MARRLAVPSWIKFRGREEDGSNEDVSPDMLAVPAGAVAIATAVEVELPVVDTIETAPCDMESLPVVNETQMVSDAVYRIMHIPCAL